MSNTSTATINDIRKFNFHDYIRNYKNRNLLNRLGYLINLLPLNRLKLYSIKLLIDQLKAHTKDFKSYVHYVKLFNELNDDNSEAIEVDNDWLNRIENEVKSNLESLEVELKTYSNNLIKESIRMSYHSLGQYYKQCGSLQSSLKNFNNMKDYCSTSNQVIDMSLNVIDLAIELNNYSLVRNTLIKAQVAFDTTSNSNNSKKVDKQLYNKLVLAGAVADLGHGHYEKVVQNLIKIDDSSLSNDSFPLDWMVTTSDVATYIALCSLATSDRSILRVDILDNDNLRNKFEAEPHTRDLIQSFYDSKYKRVFEILNDYSARYYFDPHLNPHVNNLFSMIYKRSIIQYFQSFKTLPLERISKAFGKPSNVLLGDVLSLIKDGFLNARYDSFTNTLIAVQDDIRMDVFKKAIKLSENSDQSSRQMILRMKLQQNNLLVKGQIDEFNINKSNNNSNDLINTEFEIMNDQQTQ